MLVSTECYNKTNVVHRVAMFVVMLQTHFPRNRMQLQSCDVQLQQHKFAKQQQPKQQQQITTLKGWLLIVHPPMDGH